MKSHLATPGPHHHALIELLRTAETLWNASRVFFARWDLSPSQFNILNLLYEQPDVCSQIELSRRLIMHRSNVTGLVDRLESRGLVQREDSPKDRRAFSVVLTTEGKKLIRQILPHYYLAAETIWEDMPVSKTQELVQAFQTISKSAAKLK